MTLSPADDSDYRVTIADTVECKTDTILSCSVLGVFRKDQRFKSIWEFCKHNGILQAYNASDGVNMQLELPGFVKGVAIFKYGVAYLTRNNQGKFHVRMFGCIRDVCFKFSTPHRNDSSECMYVKAGTQQNLDINTSTCKSAVLNIICDRIRHYHHPYCKSLEETAEHTLDPGLELYHLSLEKDKYIALLQDTTTHSLYCIHKNCRKSFETIDDWKTHYKISIPCPGQFTRVRFNSRGTAICYHSEKLTINPIIKKRHTSTKTFILRPLTWGSLCDPRHKDSMHTYLGKKLSILKIKQR